MAKIYGFADGVKEIADRLIRQYHPELLTARIAYVFVSEGSKKNGKPVYGKVRKFSGALEFLLEKDFMIEVAGDVWNNLTVSQRVAVVDHLLERCYGEEGEDGSMKWSVRDPEINEFSTILHRHGAWNEDLDNFLSVARQIDIDGMAEQAASSAEEYLEG